MVEKSIGFLFAASSISKDIVHRGAIFFSIIRQHPTGGAVSDRCDPD